MKRGQWQGMLAILRFNWPFYLVALGVFLFGIVGAFLFDTWWVKSVLLLAVAGSGYFIFVSLGVSHLIYDRSDLYRWGWLSRALGDAERRRMIFCHSGFDEASEALSERMENTEWKVFDHYDPVSMTEPSIGRARSLYPPTGETLAVKQNDWPVDNGWGDVVFGILAIHEFRSVEERAQWFEEAKRCTGVEGRIVVVEHVRDMANFLAFGPGFLHFHSVGNWQYSWELAGLSLIDGFRITPWVRVFILERP